MHLQATITYLAVFAAIQSTFLEAALNASTSNILRRVTINPGDTEALTQLRAGLPSVTNMTEQCDLGVILAAGLCAAGDTLNALNCIASLEKRFSRDARVSSLVGRLQVSCAQCLNGVTLTICSKCGGKGVCPLCQGSGNRSIDGLGGKRDIPCQTCSTTGLCINCKGRGNTEVACITCHGSGKSLSVFNATAFAKQKSMALLGTTSTADPSQFPEPLAAPKHEIGVSGDTIFTAFGLGRCIAVNTHWARKGTIPVTSGEMAGAIEMGNELVRQTLLTSNHFPRDRSLDLVVWENARARIDIELGARSLLCQRSFQLGTLLGRAEGESYTYKSPGNRGWNKDAENLYSLLIRSKSLSNDPLFMDVLTTEREIIHNCARLVAERATTTMIYAEVCNARAACQNAVRNLATLKQSEPKTPSNMSDPESIRLPQLTEIERLRVELTETKNKLAATTNKQRVVEKPIDVNEGNNKILLDGRDLIAWKLARSSAEDKCRTLSQPRHVAVPRGSAEYGSRAAHAMNLNAQYAASTPTYTLITEPYRECMSKTETGDWVFNFKVYSGQKTQPEHLVVRVTDYGNEMAVEGTTLTRE